MLQNKEYQAKPMKFYIGKLATIINIAIMLSELVQVFSSETVLPCLVIRNVTIIYDCGSYSCTVCESCNSCTEAKCDPNMVYFYRQLLQEECTQVWLFETQTEKFVHIEKKEDLSFYYNPHVYRDADIPFFVTGLSGLISDSDKNSMGSQQALKDTVTLTINRF